MSLYYKDDVQGQHSMCRAMRALRAVYLDMFGDLIITSVADGKHGDESLHWFFLYQLDNNKNLVPDGWCAFDIKRILTVDEIIEAKSKMNGKGYNILHLDIVPERTHSHSEWDDKHLKAGSYGKP